MERQQELAAALAQIGLMIRDDSKLARSWISGELAGEQWPLQRVVDELATTHYLYNCTGYSALCKQAFSALSEVLGDAKQASLLVQRQVAPLVRDRVLREHPVPRGSWPWLQLEAEAEEKEAE